MLSPELIGPLIRYSYLSTGNKAPFISPLLCLAVFRLKFGDETCHRETMEMLFMHGQGKASQRLSSHINGY